MSQVTHVFVLLHEGSESNCCRLIIKPFITITPGGAEATHDVPCDQSPEEIIGRHLSEQGRFAYAALCAVSLGQLFTGPERR